MEDRVLLERFRAGAGAGAHDACDSLFRSYYARLVAVAESMLRERAAAEDVAQDVMVELWRRRESIVLETSLRAYLFRAVRNRALNHIRHQRVAPRADLEAAADLAGAAADRDVMEGELNAALRAAVGDLPDRCREVFELSRVQGLKYAEIAETLGISIKTVEAQMGKAIRVLRVRLAAWLPEARGFEPPEGPE
ncbi:MAG: RNA polymerase sigma-70 factor [Gemmatimonadetes bacterium]|nr:RNA polymerase sigma-70 factor [Gemmatimonadota bacterium]